MFLPPAPNRLGTANLYLTLWSYPMKLHLRAITALTATLLALPAMADAPKGYFQVPGTDSSIQFYGNACFDVVMDGVQHGGVMQGLSTASTSTPDNARPKNTWDMTMDESRVGIRTITPSEYGDVKTRFEMDFLGTNKDAETKSVISGESKNYAHVRQMYGEWNGFLAGKTDSNFEDPDGSPNYLDWDGLLADWYGVGRINQLRYTAALDKKTVLSVAFEQNATLNLGNNGGAELPGSLTGRLQYSDAWGHISFAGAYSKYSLFVNTFNSATPTVPGSTSTLSKDSFSWAVAGHFQFGEDSFVYHVGIGDGQNGAGLQDGVSQLKANGPLVLVQAKQAEVGYEHFWTPKVHTNLFGSYVGYSEDASKGMTGSAFKSYIQVGGNVIWNITRTMQYGAEYMYGVAKTFGDGTIVNPDLSTTNAVHESKLHLQFKYKFN